MAKVLLLNVMTVPSFYLEIKSLPCEAMIFFGHPEVLDFYTKLRLGMLYHLNDTCPLNSLNHTFYLITMTPDLGDQDPFLEFNREKRKSLCDLLLTANIYTLPGPLMGIRESINESSRIIRNFQEISFNQGKPEEMLRCNRWKMFTRTEIIPVNVFPCVADEEEGVILFLSYGFKPYYERMFILVMPRLVNVGPLQMVAVLEANPSFEINLSSARDYLDYRFQASMQAGKSA